MTKDLVQIAKEFAIEAHTGTNHLYDGKPYADAHLEDVVRWGLRFIHLIPVEHQKTVLASLWGHDTFEDCRKTYNDIKRALGEKVADIIYALSNEKGKGRKDRADARYFMGIRQEEFADFGKWCDRLANASNSVRTGHGMLKVHIAEHAHYKEELYHKHHYRYAALVHELDKLLCTEEELNVIAAGSVVSIPTLSPSGLFVIESIYSRFENKHPETYVNVMNIDNPNEKHNCVALDSIRHF